MASAELPVFDEDNELLEGLLFTDIPHHQQQQQQQQHPDNNTSFQTAPSSSTLSTSSSSGQFFNDHPPTDTAASNSAMLSSTKKKEGSKRKYDKFRELCRQSLLQQEKEFLQRTGLLEAISNFPEKNEIDTAKQEALFEAGQRAYNNYFSQGDVSQHKGRSIYNVPLIIVSVR